jgi:UDP-N-acetylmuramate--alanine ligase
MRIGIFFGGSSREREISFAGGRTVYDNLDKSLFSPVPIFVDSLGNLILLDWQYLYKGTIRDFYPPVNFLPKTAHQFQIYIESIENLSDVETSALLAAVGKKISYSELSNFIDFAFLALHGEWGEDGQIQGLLESMQIPYSGSGIRASSIGMDKSFQKKVMNAGGFESPAMQIIKRRDWLCHIDKKSLLKNAAINIGLPLVVRPANQGSSIGVSIIQNIEELESAIDAAFFIRSLSAEEWNNFDKDKKVQLLRDWTDIRYGIGFPMTASEIFAGGSRTLIYHPENLLAYLDNYFSANPKGKLQLEAHNSEQRVVLEGFIEGREFSCVVIQDDNGAAVALPPTEIIKGKEVFDYRSKYMAGLSRKITPIDLPEKDIEAIRAECERLFDYLEFNVYARIDGFIKKDGTIILNDPNTTSGMLPSSFFFHQAAEIGLNPSNFLTYIIRTSLLERIRNSMRLNVYEALLLQLDRAISDKNASGLRKKRVAVILGGYSSERHISVESGRNIYEKLSSAANYEAIPIFLTGSAEQIEMYRLPINLLLKDNADDIRDKIKHFSRHPVTLKIQKQCSSITERFTGSTALFEPQELTFEDLKEKTDEVFIALHGRPGEDGLVQSKLEALKIPFNGSSSDSAAITINKYETLQRLKKAGFTVTNQLLVDADSFEMEPEAALNNIEKNLEYPLIAKPVDDGCSSAVKKIKNRTQLKAFLETIFRKTEDLAAAQAAILQLKPKEEFPIKKTALLETLIEKGDAIHFLEITGGLLTRYNEHGAVEYEIFEPSETLAGGEVLSLEEKFLAGEGQNITPARFAVNGISHEHISAQVRRDLEKAARTLGVSGYARIDAFVRIFADARVETIVIEVNSLPGMTPATCIFHQCAINGYSPAEFIDNILKFGEERNKKL